MGLFSRKKRKDKQKHKDIQKHKRPLPVIEALEPRILLSADLPGLDVGDFDVDDAADTDVDRILAEALEAFEAEAAKASADQSDIREAPAEELAETLPPSTEFDDETRHELIIVDPSVPDYELLLADVNAVGGEATRLNVVLIDPQRSGIDQISEILASRSELDAIHLISHGSDAAIRIGGDTLDLALLQSEPEAISGWGGALSEEGDILIYGCNVTETEAGQVLIDTLAEMTRADVAASDDLTGHESLGGDWELEYRAGSIETDVAPSLTAQGEWVETLAAPVLSGANDLTAIDEDPASNPGTLVSALVAGQVSDPDGPSSGIAVVAVDDTNGTWEYTTDGGTNWTAFDAVDTTTARLLAADANTSVRFVPDADWNGAVTNGVTFHAWDQTSGTAGGTADLNNSYTVRDEFSTVSYTNNDGSANWVSGWSENDDSGIAGPTGGEIRITGGQLRLDDAISTVGAHASLTRHVDLSNATSATFSFDYDGNSSGMPDRFKAWASDNSGSTWVELEHFTPAQTGLFSGSGSYDLSSFIGLTSDVVIKFSLEEGFASGTDYVDFDNVQIEYTSADNVGGVTAYSAASASASITVNPVNYAPTDLSGGIEVNTDGGNDAYLISNTGLSQSLTATTVEIRFAANDTPYEPVFISFNNPTDDELSIQIDEPSKNLEIDFGAGTVAYASAIDYRAALVDGSVHTLSVTWDNGAGDWSVYIDGVFTESGTGLSAGTSLDTTNGQFVFGQEQDGLDSGYDSSQHFSGTFYDVRIWNDVRTAAEIAQNYQQQLDLTPAEAAAVGLVANWQMDGFDGSNQVVDIVSANNLGIAHVSGTGFTTGAVESQLSVDEGSANGTRIGYVTAADADPGETFSYSLTDAAGGRFVIDPVTGEITVANGSLLDYETATSHDITVRVEDSGGLSYNEVLTIQVNDVNYFAPVLAGANDLTAINEDNVNNSGTLVSTLIAGHFTDAEGGASMGIAVIAVDDTNGTWQYTIDGGSNWLSFGAVDTASARMLADDASTSVRFVPDADWNGTVTDGITFYAWDQTSGSNGAAADLTGTINETVLDQFDAVSYGGDDGSVGWVGDWQEVGDSDGSAVGDVSISTAGSVIAGPYLRIDLSTLGTGISRAVDLSSATSATLSFTYEQNTTSLGGQVALEVFDGSSWHTVQTYDIDSDFYTGTVGVYQSFDISAYADANTEIRFRTTEAATGDEIYLDDVQIAYTRASLDVGAATAFSAATASSSVVVNPVNDAPVVSSPSGTYPYTEGAGAVVLGGSATVKDVDSADFAGGQLVYQITNNGLAEDRLDIRNQGTSAGQIGVSGTDITYGGVVIGTYTGATTGGTALVVSFNSSASEAAVEATLQNVTYENTSDDPTASTRTLQVYATDGDGGTSSTVTGYVAVTPVNDAPLNTFPTAPSTDQNTNLAFTGPNQIQIADVDHSGGNLRVQLSVGAGGLLTFGDMTGLTFSTGDGTDDANMVFTGSLTDINAALGTLVFKPSADFHGSVSFSINTNDLGNSGTDPGTSGDAGSEEDFDTFNITVKPPGALWLATEGDVADPSGVPGLSSWSSGTVLELGDPNLSLEPGTTDGTLSALMNFDAMVADGNADIASLDYVSRDVTVGTDAGYEFQLLQGDVLVTFASTETLDGTMYNADSLLVFRPTIVGDFSAGTWMRLLENPIGQGIGSVALVEQDTAIGGYTVTAGNFLMVAYGGTDIRYVDVTRTGSGTTAAASSVLIQGAAIGLGNGSQSIDALELIHSDVTIGGASLTAGQLLIGLESTDSSVGSTSPIEVTDQDIAVLTVTATELTGAPVGEGTVSLFLQGSDIGLNTTAERNAALALWTDPGDVDPPETDNVAASGNEDATSISITLTGSDAGGTIDFFRLNGLPANGTLYTDVALTTVASAGLDYAATGEALTLYFVPDADWNGTATFDYVARDDSGLLDTSPATATITVNPLNDDPASNADAYSVDEDASLTVDWWDSDWSRRQELTFDNLAQTETLTDFPVLIVLNASNIDYALTKDDGSDLRFFAADGTPLAYQIEEWNEGGDSSVWVRVPQITGNSNSDSIMMYYGNAAADPVGSVTGVWDSDFVGVWHLNEEQAGTGTSGIYEDATGQGHDGIDRIAATGQDGQVTDGQQFGANDWIEIAQDPSLDLKDSMTISFWIKPTSDSGTFNRVVEKGLWGYNDSYYFGGGNGTNDLTFYLNGQEVIDTADGVLTVGVWQHAAVSYTSNGDGTGTARLYLDGVEIATGNYTNGVVPGNTGRLAIGHSDASYDFDGFIDEVQISKTDRSADWIAAHYQATKNQFGSEFVQFGAAEVAPATDGVMTNDADIDGDLLSASIVTGPNNAAAFTFNKDGTFSYTPNADFNGVDTFTYKVNDGSTDGNVQTVTITVNPIDDAPIARPDGVHLAFDGDDFIQVADHVSLQMNNTVTMEAWINHDGTGTGSQLIVNKEGEYEMGITADTGEIMFAIAESANTWAWHNTGYFVTAGEWTHVAVTYDGGAGEAKTYINGELVDTYAQSGVIGDVYPAFNDLYIGGRENATTQRFQGQIDEVRVWSATRTAGEIQSNMDGQLAGAEVGLVGNWRLDGAAGGAVVDQSTFGNDGILGGSEGAAATPSYQGYITDQNTVLTIVAGTGVLANDTDADGGSLTVTNLDTTGMLGNLVLNTVDGSFSYDPNGAFDHLDAGEQATETFTYTANDGALDSNTVTATITIIGVNDAPTTTPVTLAAIAEDSGARTITQAELLANAGDVDVEALTATGLAISAGSGTLSDNGNGTWNYTPALNDNSSVSFSYTITDGADTVAGSATLDITPINDDPINAGGLPTDITVTEDMSSDVDLSAIDLGDVDEAGGNLILTLSTSTGGNLTAVSGGGVTVGGSGSGILTLTGSQADLNTYLNTASNVQYLHGTANLAGNDVDTLSVVVNDNGNSGSGGGTDQALGTVNVDISAVNDAGSFGGAVSGSGAEDGGAISGTLSFTDAIDGASAPNFTVTGAAGNGSASIDAVTGLWSYTPNSDFNGNDSFTVTVTDDDGHSETQVINLTVTAVVDIVGDSLTTDEEMAVSANVLTGTNGTSADDFEGTPVLSAVTQGSNGSVTFLADGTVTYTPDADFHGSDSFTYTITAGGVTETATVNVTVNPTADLTAGDDSFTFDEDTVLSDTVAANDSTTSGGTLAYAVDTGVGQGTLVFNSDGTFDYTPNADFHGADSFTYTVTDATSGESATRTVSLTINSVDDAVTIGGDTSGSGDEDTVISGTLTATDAADGLTDGTVFTVSTDGTNGSATIDPATGLWTYTPAADFNGTDSFTVTVTDDDGHTDTQVINVTLIPVADVPVIGGIDMGSVTEGVDPDADNLLETSGVLTISDPDAGESAFIANSVSGEYGALIIDVDGNWSYAADDAQTGIQQLDAGESVNDVLTVTTVDGTSHAVTITINGAEDAPVMGGSVNGAVAEDGTLTATGTLTISDVDAADNPIGFVDEAGTPGDNGYGSFTLSGGAWRYTLDNAHPAVQGLAAGGSLTDTHNFIATDGSTRLVSVEIRGEEEPLPVVIEPSYPEHEPLERSVEPEPEPTSVEEPVEEVLEAEAELLAGTTDPSVAEPAVDEWLAATSGPGQIVPDEVFLQVLHDAPRPETREIQRGDPVVAKPTPDTPKTFLQELKSFWKEDDTVSGIQLSEVRLRQDFWDGLDTMRSDLDESIVEEERKTALSTEAAAGVGISMTAGFVSWALRAGSMAASFLTAMPAWRHFDPMPILGEDNNKRQGSVAGDRADLPEDEEVERERSVDDLFER